MTDNTKQLIEDTNNRQWSYSFLKSDRFASFLDLIPEAAILSNQSGQIILKACNEPILIDQHTYQLSSSIGISINESDTFDEKNVD